MTQARIESDAARSDRLSVVTIGCHDFDTMRSFYTALGWPDAHPPNSPTKSKGAPDGWTSFCTAGGILALWGEDLLARESGVDAPPPTTAFAASPSPPTSTPRPPSMPY